MSDTASAGATVITLCGTNEKNIIVKPRSVDASKEYKVTLDNTGFTYIISGEKLKRNGIAVDINASLSSELILLEENI